MIRGLKFASIPVTDQDRALVFYTEKLGFRLLTDQPFNEKQRWIELGIPGTDSRIVLFRFDDGLQPGTKMNITFWASSIPNQRIVSGIRAATGTFLPNSATGAPADSSTRHEPARMPRGTPITTASPKPISTRRMVAMILAGSPRSFHRAGKLRMTSTGLGKITGDTRRCSAVAPLVATNHKASIRTTAPSPIRRPTIGGGALRRSNRPGLGGDIVG